MRYDVRIRLEYWTTVEAGSRKEARQIVEGMELPASPEWEYSDDSFEIKYIDPEKL